MEETIVNPSTWLCEASLYTAWTYCGDLRAHTDALLLGIGADEVAMVVKQYEQETIFKALLGLKIKCFFCFFLLIF